MDHYIDFMFSYIILYIQIILKLKYKLMKHLCKTIVVYLCACLCMHTSVFAANSQATSTIKKVDHSTILKQAELIPIMINGDKNNRINIVIMNKWSPRDTSPYNKAKLREKFINDIKSSLLASITYGDEKAQTAYAHYKKFFNIYGLWWPKQPAWNEYDNQDAIDFLRAHYFLPWTNKYTGWVTILAMPNTIHGGGGASRNLEERIGHSVIAGRGIDKMLHEIAHTCMSIGDEYTGGGQGVSSVPTYTSSLEYRRNKIKWRKWIDKDVPLPTPYIPKYRDKIGAFEGCQYHITDYFRPSAQGCIMGAGIFDNTSKMCAICNQRVSMRVYTLVDIINKTTPERKDINIAGPVTKSFSVDHITPTPNTQVVRWFLNDKQIAEGKDKIDVKFGNLKHYKLKCSITDETSYIRPDPPYAEYPKRTIIWNITNSNLHADSNPIKVKISEKKDRKTKILSLLVDVKGAKEPYTYIWSNKSTNSSIKNPSSGIYDLTVVDSDFKEAKAKYNLMNTDIDNSSYFSIKENDLSLEPNVDIYASTEGKDNGKILINMPNKGNYSFLWKDQKIHYTHLKRYEAESGIFTFKNVKKEKFWTASNDTYVNFNNEEGIASWKIEVSRAGVYPLDIIYASVKGNTPTSFHVSANYDKAKKIIVGTTRPEFIGWETATVDLYLNKGINTINVVSEGHSLPNLDYIRVPSSYEGENITSKDRNNLKPKDYTLAITDGKGKKFVKTIIVPESYPYKIKGMKIIPNRSNGVKVSNPLDGYSYQWYSSDVSYYARETIERPLYIGNSFHPTKEGNYYVSAKNIASKAESENRIGFAVGEIRKKNNPKINPYQLGRDALVMWFDASDLDGDGREDTNCPKRGIYKTWKDKSTNQNATMSMYYQPNTLNGKGISRFDNIWVQHISKKYTGYQTIIMLYKESDMTLPGYSPFKALDKYMPKSKDSNKAIFDYDKANYKTKNGKVYLNGEEINPFKTPNPMKYSILTVELASPAYENCNVTQGYFEGSIAEIIMINRKLTEKERKGIEEYLSEKWFYSIGLELNRFGN